jgi:hypothetical protein
MYTAKKTEVRLNTSALMSNSDLYPWVFHILKVLPRSSWVWTHGYHILMGYLTSTCRCKETYEYSQVFSRELIEIIQLSINIAIFKYPRWLKSLIFIFRFWQFTNIDSKLYICHRYLHKYPWYISKSILGSLKTHRHRYLRLMSMILVSILMSKLIYTHGWLRVMFSLKPKLETRIDKKTAETLHDQLIQTLVYS